MGCAVGSGTYMAVLTVDDDGEPGGSTEEEGTIAR